ncbi:unnamed protein product [Fusarium graminearum]|nr:unnamed protein product [Fusarium graminearum]
MCTDPSDKAQWKNTGKLNPADRLQLTCVDSTLRHCCPETSSYGYKFISVSDERKKGLRKDKT